MNKITKGAIATAAGIALLLGGAGTFALWNGATTVAGGSISTGVLTIANVANTTGWQDTSVSGSPVTLGTGAAVVAVPGDQYTLTQNITINETGRNAKAILTVAGATPSNGFGTNLTIVMNVTGATPATGPSFAAGTGTNNWVVTPGTTASTTVTVTLTVTFNSLTAGTTEQGDTAALNLSAVNYTLTQTR